MQKARYSYHLPSIRTDKLIYFSRNSRLVQIYSEIPSLFQDFQVNRHHSLPSNKRITNANTTLFTFAQTYLKSRPVSRANITPTHQSSTTCEWCLFILQIDVDQTDTGHNSVIVALLVARLCQSYIGGICQLSKPCCRLFVMTFIHI